MFARVNPFENKKIDENVMFILFSFFVLSLPYSKAFISIFSGLIFLVSLFFSMWRKTFLSTFRSDFTWIGLVVVYCVYIVGFIFTNDSKLGVYELNKELNWVMLSLGVFMSPRLSKKKWTILLFLFAFGVTVSTFFSFFKMFFAPTFGIGNFREVNFISHIPFSFQISVSIFILGFSFLTQNSILRLINPIIRVIWVGWLVFFLIVLKSMLGLVSFYITSILLVVYILRSSIITKGKKWLMSGVVICYFIPLVYIGNVVWDFYDIKDPNYETAERFTKQGNDYYFDITSKFKENGHYVYWFVCEKELKEIWNTRSNYEFYGKNDRGYVIAETLLRYMTSKGLRKDAYDFVKLTDRDIRNVELGIGNYIYDAPAFSIYPRIYETVWEIDRYLLTGDPNNQSLSQRIEYSKAAFYIIKRNFWFGIGTGNFKEAYKNAYIGMGSKLNEENYGMTHNQYLSYWIKFGLFGLVFILFLLFFLAHKKKLFKNGLFVLFFIYMLVANMGDTNWETHTGLSFFVFFFSIFLWHSQERVERVN